MGLAHAAVHDHGEAGRLGDPLGLLGLDALLEPQHLGPDVDRLAGDLRRLVGRAEDVDDVDRAVDLGERARATGSPRTEPPRGFTGRTR